MIKRIEIDNYRSCIKTSFDIHPHLSVLIGPNGGGKTNILTALQLLNKFNSQPDYSNVDDSQVTPSNLKVWFDFNEKKIILTSKLHSYTDVHNNDIIVSADFSWYMKDFTGNGKRITTPLWMLDRMHRKYYTRTWNRDIMYHYNLANGRIERSTAESNIIEQPLQMISKFTKNMQYYSASQFTNPTNCPVSFEIEKEGRRSRGISLKGHTRFMFNLYSEYISNSLGYQQFLDIIGPRGIGLVNKIGFKEMITSSVDYKVRSGGKFKKIKRDKILVIPQFIIGKKILSPNQLSEGTFKTITLIFNLVTDSSAILLIEEPEVCVHHGLLSSILELIKAYSQKKQIIISTHSDFVLDHVSPQNVYIVSSESNNGTKISHIPKSLSKHEFMALKEFLNSEGNLGEYWKLGALE